MSEHPVPTGDNGFAIAGLIVAILSVVFPLALVALPLSIMGLIKSRKRDDRKGRGMSIAGLIIGCVGILTSIAWVLVVIEEPTTPPTTMSRAEEIEERRQRTRATATTRGPIDTTPLPSTYLSDPPPPRTLSTAPITMSRAEVAEMTFELFMLDDPELSQLPMSMLKNMAVGTCELLDEGMTAEEMLLSMMIADAEDASGLSSEAWAVFLGSAIAGYCPEHKP